MQDAEAVRCVEALRTKAARQKAWKWLLAHGEEVITRVSALCADEEWIAHEPARRAEAARAAVSLNQSICRREWVSLLSRSAAAARGRSSGAPGAPPMPP